MYSAMRDELEKIALLKELVALGAKDIPHTPRLVMKHRDAATRVALGEAADAAYGRIAQPWKQGVERLAAKIPVHKKTPAILRRIGGGIVRDVASDPVGGVLTAVAPGGSIIPVAKRVLTKGIIALDPSAARLMPVM